jgi:hypothetical protein
LAEEELDKFAGYGILISVEANPEMAQLASKVVHSASPTIIKQ